MVKPPTIQPASVPGPDFDPMDWVVQDLENVDSFLSYIESNPQDLKYLNTHLSGILGLRRTISHHLNMLADEPYNYPPSRLKSLHQGNESLFVYLEGVVGAMSPWNETAFKKAVKAVEEVFSKFDNELTP